MTVRTSLRSLLALFCAALAVSASAADDEPIFHSKNPLAPRDEYGVLHQMPNVDATDYAPRSGSRWYYYFKTRHELLRDPAYVASLQVVLRNRGYYCGPIDGIMSEDVSDAIARVQKNYVQRVTGTLTVPVRRALNLP
ncbi:MAG TPA: peptidoglycan-binding protein [Chthoniobacterales bacterium]|nr:peptidoglycan-binding protein [Chthoniobacterales bacterium]